MKCVVCGSPTPKLKSGVRRKWCSQKCMGNDPEIIEKKRQANIKKFGTDNPMYVAEIKNQRNATNLEKYGAISPSANPDVINKRKENNLKKYGVEEPAQLESAKKQAAARQQARSEEQIKEMVKKAKATNLERYGAEVKPASHIPQEVLNKVKDPNWLYEQRVTFNKSFTEIGRELGVSRHMVRENFVKLGLLK